MADAKITALSENTDPQPADVFAMVDDPAGTPVTEKITVENLLLATVDIIPSARVYDSGDTSVSDSTATALTFDTEEWDTDAIHDVVSNTGRLTCKTAGKYLVIGQITWEASNVGSRQLLIQLNAGSFYAYIEDSAAQGTKTRQFLATIVDLAVNDYVELVALQTSGGALNVETGALTSPYFMMCRIGD